MSEPNDLHLLIVADDSLARAGLAALLADQPGIQIVGQVPGDSELPTALDVFDPDVILWDLGWDPAVALERSSQIGDAQLPIVALIPNENDALQSWSPEMPALLSREAPAALIVSALVAAADGLMVLDPTLADTLPPPSPTTVAPLDEELTPREIEVLQLLAQGLSNKAIGYELQISEHTVKFHVNAVMSKLDAQNRTEAAVRATLMGLIVL
jgi:DNA-binding NarL/FixJ family response regulator